MEREPALGGELAAWLSARHALAETLEPLPGDVSPRRYYRLATADGGSAVLALYPPPVRDACERFLTTTRLLADAGVRVPAVRGAACTRGWMLLEDVGEGTLYDLRERPWDELGPYLEAGVEAARRIAALPPPAVAGLNPPLGGELLARELEQTREVFLEPRGLTGGSDLAARLDRALGELCRALAAEPPVPCHRDLMARNLVPLGAGRGLAVLDHQDLRLGPPCYDLASLLNDSLFPPPEVEAALLARGPTPAPGLSYHRAAAQRTLKAVGTFAAFARQGSERHLPLIPPTLRRALAHLAQLPEAARLAPELGRVWRRAGVLD